jgi:glutaminyl-peptide cyclotransferase
MKRTLLLLLLLLLAACGGDDETDATAVPTATPVPLPQYELQNGQPVQLRVEVLETYPHDSNAYTQGLLLHEDSFYESTGLRGESTLREVNPTTGEVIRSVPVEEIYFAEGLALVDNRLIQLTWQAGVAFEYDLETFEQTETFTYDTEGWGLCYDGDKLYMSDGSTNLYVRHAETFELESQITVTLNDMEVTNLNELECVGDYVYANVWFQDTIYVVEKDSGIVVAMIDGSGLLTAEQYAELERGAVLNGIAYNPSDGTFYITGKLWPELFKVRFVEVE